jgi:rhomboid protease GluP
VSSYSDEPYVGETTSPPPPRSATIALPSGPPTVTYFILGLTILIYLLQMGSQFFLGTDLPVTFGDKANNLIRAGQLWRLITPVLLHGGLLHIGFNMYALLIFGPGLERHFGHLRFALLYLLTGFSGNVFSFLFSSGYSIGASTAIFGLIAAEGVFFYQNRKLFGEQAKRAIGNIILVAGVNLLLGLSPGIDNWGHIGGLLGGLIFAWFAGPRWEVQGIYPALHLVDRREFVNLALGVALVTLIFGGLTGMGMLYPISP